MMLLLYVWSMALIAFGTLGPSPSVLHDFHLSKTEVHYNVHNQSLEVTLHIFIDDLELAMGQLGMDSVYISTHRERADADSLIHQYLKTAFAVEVDGQPVTFSFLGKEESEDLIAIWCYLEGLHVSDPKEVVIRNSVLTEIYEDQKNMVSFTTNQIRKFFLMDDEVQEAQIRL